MKKLSKSQMANSKGGSSSGEPTLVRTTRFTGLAGNPCRHGIWFQRWYSDGSVKTYSLLGTQVEG